VVNTYPRFANVGPALLPVNLHDAAPRLHAGDHVLVFSIGSVSTAGAAVLRWGDVALGPAIAPPEARE
jgi:3-oxoacyl-[acyl-carrier-protein] synthase-3